MMAYYLQISVFLSVVQVLEVYHLLQNKCRVNKFVMWFSLAEMVWIANSCWILFNFTPDAPFPYFYPLAYVLYFIVMTALTMLSGVGKDAETYEDLFKIHLPTHLVVPGGIFGLCFAAWGAKLLTSG